MGVMQMANKIQQRRDIAINWESVNPILSSGEIAYTTDFSPWKQKVGNGASRWSDLEYFSAEAYTHPSTHPPSIIAQDANNRFVTDLEKYKWNNYISTPTTIDEVYNVKYYGAVGNGITDDTTSIQTAINSLHALGGGVLFFPCGSYKVTSTLILYENISICGTGIFSTIILPITNNMTLFSLAYSVLTEANICMHDFEIDCTNHTGIKAMSFTLCLYTELYNLKFKGCLTNVYVDRGRMHNHRDLISTGNDYGLRAGNMIYTSTSDTDWVFDVRLESYRIHNNGPGVNSPMVFCRRNIATHIHHFSLNDGYQGGVVDSQGIVLDNDCQGCKISDSIIVKPYYGIVLQTGTGINVYPTFNTITNVDIDQSQTVGIWLIDGRYTTIIGGCITASMTGITTQGILLNGGMYTIVDNVLIQGYNGTGGAGINIKNTSHVKISNNKIDGCSNSIGIIETVTNAKIINNELTNTNLGVAGNYAQTDNVVTNNGGFKTADFCNGTTSISSAGAYSFTVPHGLVKAPDINKIIASLTAVNGSFVMGGCAVASVDATNITVVANVLSVAIAGVAKVVCYASV